MWSEMHVAVVSYDVPTSVHDAHGPVVTSFIVSLRAAGHRVTCCALLDPANPEAAPERAERIERLKALGVDVLPIEVTLPQLRRTWGDVARQLVRPTLEELYPWTACAPQVGRALERIRPDVLFIFETYQGLAATHGLTLAPRFALFGDPDHLPGYYRRRMQRVSERPLPKSLYRAVLDRHRRKAMRRLLAGLDGGGAVAAHYAEWFRRNGLSHGLYVRNAVPDDAGSGWRARRAASPAPPKPKMILVGHLRGTATLAGVYLFAEEILPILEARLGPEGFEAHIIGRFPPPADLAQKLARPSVRLRWFVEDLDPEWLTADVFLVPTPIELGVRTRVIFGWMFGCCVVAHEANVPGLPEMRHEENALLAHDGRGLAEAILRAFDDAPLRTRLGERGRQTYERWFAPEVAGRRLVDELTRLRRSNGPCKSSS